MFGPGRPADLQPEAVVGQICHNEPMVKTPNQPEHQHRSNLYHQLNTTNTKATSTKEAPERKAKLPAEKKPSYTRTATTCSNCPVEVLTI